MYRRVQKHGPSFKDSDFKLGAYFEMPCLLDCLSDYQKEKESIPYSLRGTLSTFKPVEVFLLFSSIC